ncbi:hypothetical protein YC2023_010837 [Brassica napus]
MSGDRDPRDWSVVLRDVYGFTIPLNVCRNRTTIMSKQTNLHIKSYLGDYEDGFGRSRKTCLPKIREVRAMVPEEKPEETRCSKKSSVI